MLEQAFHDGKLTRHGAPSWAALSAYAWLMDDHRQTAPSFRWCCSWISDHPATVRAQGLRNQHAPGRLGGLPAILQSWADTENAFAAHHHSLTQNMRNDIVRRKEVRDRFLAGQFRSAAWARQFTFEYRGTDAYIPAAML